MRKNSLLYKLFILLFVLSVSCKTPVQADLEDASKGFDKPLLETNQYMRERHRDLIEAFVDRAGWEMIETPSGLWMQILSRGDQNGNNIQDENFVSYIYETKLLNGTLCYASDTTEPKSIVIGKGNVEAGIEEGLLKLRKGASARLILPPHLAHGNFGDMKKIPGSAILIVELEVMDVKR